jgi:endonuclease G
MGHVGPLIDTQMIGRLGSLQREIEAMRHRTVRELNSDAQIADRHRFLAESNPSSLDAETFFERIIGGNDLQPVNYLHRGAIAARAIARVDIRESPARRVGWGTGFLISPGVFITNHHVFPDAGMARSSVAHFNFEAGLDDTLKIYQEFALDPTRLFFSHEQLDFAIVAVNEASQTDGTPLSRFGFLPLLDVPGKASVGEWLTIIQHPAGQPKQICVRENRLIRRAADVLWYSSDTVGGSSGSPVFNNDWYVVALHHMGVPETKDGKPQTKDGRNFDPGTMSDQDVNWIANEGIRVSRIVQTLKTSAVRDHPLLAPLFAATPSSARVGADTSIASGEALGHTPPPAAWHALPSPPTATGTGSPVPPALIPTIKHAAQGDPAMTTDNPNLVPLNVTLHVDRDELVRAVGASIGNAPMRSAAEMDSIAAQEAAKRNRTRPAAFEAPFDPDYSKRAGYDADFLGKGKHRVNLPTLSPALRKLAAHLIEAPSEYVLKYHNYSVSMHAERRLAIYAAANVNFGDRYQMSRPSDVWRTDPRIESKHQITNFYYASNQFDRGHLTRREDLEFGKTPVAALQSAADTCHWTNCTPQHARFNQNKEVWQGIELYVLEAAIVHNRFSAQIITGPVFSEDDPEYKKIQYPLAYWKVVAAVNGAGELFATAYVASQRAAIDEHGIEAAPLEPFGAFRNYQVRIAEVERLTGLQFTSAKNTPLSISDPLEARRGNTLDEARRRRRRRDYESSSAASAVPPGYIELDSVEDIVL